jgi:predicted GNAT family acetyltransferase
VETLSNYIVVHKPSDNRFEIELGEQKATLIYSIRAGLFIMLNTYVPNAFRGRGIAGKLAGAALEYANKEGLKVRSYCSYTTYFIETHPEWQGLLG